MSNLNKTRIIAFVQQKGGCGKTTTVVNIGAYLASFGNRVLLVDLDPQANLTQSLGIRTEEVSCSILDLLLRPSAGLNKVLVSTSFGSSGKLDLLPSSPDLVSIEVSLAGRYGKEWLLDEALATARENYNYILIDPPPALGLLTVNALMASTEVIIPFQCHIFSISALEQLQKTLRQIQKKNKRLKVGGVVATLFDARYSLSHTVFDTINDLFGALVFKTKIGLNSKLAEAPGAGMPVLFYAPTSAGAKAYKKLASEIMERGKNTHE